MASEGSVLGTGGSPHGRLAGGQVSTEGSLSPQLADKFECRIVEHGQNDVTVELVYRYQILAVPYWPGVPEEYYKELAMRAMTDELETRWAAVVMACSTTPVPAEVFDRLLALKKYISSTSTRETNELTDSK